MAGVIDHLLQTKLSLSPLAGISDLPFRLICRRYGCRYAFTEMVDARAILHAFERTSRMLQTNSEDQPLGVQLVGDDIDAMEKAALKCQDMGFDLMNINAACPVPKIKRKGKGVALMNEPDKIAYMVERLVKVLDIPVVIKIRSGFDQDSFTYLPVAKAAEKAGASAIFIHPRSAENKYGSTLRKDHIVELKHKLSIPVVASGDVLTPRDAQKMFEETGCDAISVARGSFGQPWIFEQTEALLAQGIAPREVPLEEIRTVANEHFHLLCQYYGLYPAISRMYKHMTWYFSGHKDLDFLMRNFREKIQKEEDFDLFVRQF